VPTAKRFLIRLAGCVVLLLLRLLIVDADIPRWFYSSSSDMNAIKTLVLIALPLMAMGFGYGIQQQHPIFGTKQRTARFMVQTNGEKHGSATVTNIFQDYTKPIVLVGHSGQAGELSQLGKSLSSQLMGTVIKPDIDSKDDMIFPNVIVLDFKDKDHTEMAKSLYQDHDMLSIYVNVQQEGQDYEDSVFVPFSDYEVCINDEGRDMESDEWTHIEWEVSRLVARALLPPAIPGDTSQSVNSAHLTMGSHTFFLSLSFPDITAVEPYTREMCRDVDAMEYRTDLLTCRDSRFDLLYGLQLLRKYCRPHVTRVPALPLARGVLEDVMPMSIQCEREIKQARIQMMPRALEICSIC
jgi:hypothetical protein